MRSDRSRCRMHCRQTAVGTHLPTAIRHWRACASRQRTRLIQHFRGRIRARRRGARGARTPPRRFPDRKRHRAICQSVSARPPPPAHRAGHRYGAQATGRIVRPADRTAGQSTHHAAELENRRVYRQTDGCSLQKTPRDGSRTGPTGSRESRSAKSPVRKHAHHRTYLARSPCGRGRQLFFHTIFDIGLRLIEASFRIEGRNLSKNTSNTGKFSRAPGDRADRCCGGFAG